MADFEQNLKRLRALAAEHAAKLSFRGKPDSQLQEQGVLATSKGPVPLPPLPPAPKRAKTDWRINPGAAGTAMQSVIGSNCNARDDAQTAEGEDSTWTIVEVPEKLLGLFIGKQGAGVKQLQAETGAKLQVGLLNQGGIRRVCIHGTAEQQAHAKRLVESFVEQKGLQEAHRQATVTDVMLVPERFVGKIIGPHGDVIKQVKEQSGAWSVEMQRESSKDSEFRNLSIKGLPEEIELAKEKVELLLLDSYRNVGIFNAPLEKKHGRKLQALQQVPSASCPGGPQFLMPCDALVSTPAFDMSQAFDCQTLFEAPDESIGSNVGPPSSAALSPVLSWHPALCEWMTGFSADEEDSIDDARIWASIYARDELCVAYFRAHFSELGLHPPYQDDHDNDLAAMGA